MYVLVTGDSARYYTLTDLRRDNPGTSFPSAIPDKLAADFDVYPCAAATAPPIDDAAQRIERGDPEWTGGQWRETWVVIDLSPEDIAEREATMRQANKAQASALLTETDYLDLPNTAAKIENTDAILAYRDALRSIAIDPPVTVAEWPVRPSTIWMTAS